MDEIFSPKYLAKILVASHVEGELLKLESPTLTVSAAARAAGTEVNSIVKSVLFLVNNQPLLAIVSGMQKISRKAIAQHLNISQKNVRLADAGTVLDITGYPVGSVPPFGHKQALRTLIDPSVLQKKVVYAGGGAANTLLRISPKDILRLTSAEVVNLFGDNLN